MPDLSAHEETILSVLHLDTASMMDPLRLARRSSLEVDACSSGVGELLRREPALVEILPGSSVRPGMVQLTAAGKETARNLAVPPRQGPAGDLPGVLLHDKIERAIIDVVADQQLRERGGGWPHGAEIRRVVRDKLPDVSLQAAKEASDRLRKSGHLADSGGLDPGFHVTLRGLMASDWGVNALDVLDRIITFLKNPGQPEKPFGRYRWRLLREASDLPYKAFTLADVVVHAANLGAGPSSEDDEPQWTAPTDVDLLLDGRTALQYVRDHLPPMGVPAPVVSSEAEGWRAALGSDVTGRSPASSSTIHLGFSPNIDGPGTWQCWTNGSHDPSSTSGVALHLAFSSSSRCSERTALETAQRIVERDPLHEWLHVDGERWSLDMGQMRTKFAFLAACGWLTGIVPIRWTYEEKEDTFAGRARQKLTLSMTLTPESIAASRAKARREDDLSDATRILVLEALWILECEVHMWQATAFSLTAGAAITCAHVRCEDVACEHVRAFRADDVTSKYSVRWLASNSDIDLARLKIEGPTFRELEPAPAADVRQLDRIWVAGFPNYRVGDTAHVSPGLVSAFRTVSGTRRLLTSARIVSGNSGGPGFTSDGRVVGVAVTGADCPENADKTDNHGLIPIDAVRFLERVGND
jgi:hypothetical protein